MSGQFILWRLSIQDKESAMAAFGCTWSEAAHTAGTLNGAGNPFPGWTTESRNLLNRVRNGNLDSIGDRNLLPPHKYLGFSAQGQLDGEKLKTFMEKIYKCYWVVDLQRPRTPGVGLTDLCLKAREAWNQGKKQEALAEQIMHGDTSIEVYYHGGREI